MFVPYALSLLIFDERTVPVDNSGGLLDVFHLLLFLYFYIFLYILCVWEGVWGVCLVPMLVAAVSFS